MAVFLAMAFGVDEELAKAGHCKTDGCKVNSNSNYLAPELLLLLTPNISTAETANAPLPAAFQTEGM